MIDDESGEYMWGVCWYLGIIAYLRHDYGGAVDWLTRSLKRNLFGEALATLCVVLSEIDGVTDDDVTQLFDELYDIRNDGSEKKNIFLARNIPRRLWPKASRRYALLARGLSAWERDALTSYRYELARRVTGNVAALSMMGARVAQSMRLRADDALMLLLSARYKKK